MADDAATLALLQAPLQLGRGRRSIPVTAVVTRDITLDDLLKASEPGHTKPQAIKPGNLRQSHHQLAQILAGGAKPFEAAAITGYSPSRISILQADPSFAELVTYYTDMEQEQYSSARADMHKRLASLGFDTVEVLHEKLLESPDSFTVKELLAITEVTADRTGFGKTSTVNNVHEYAISGETLAAIKAATERGSPASPADRGALLRLATRATAELHPSASEADGIEGSGRLVREEGGEGDQAEAPRDRVALSLVVPVQRSERT